MKIHGHVCVGIALACSHLVCGAESLTIREVPQKLPRDTGLSTYSPPLSFTYNGLRSGVNYTLKVWLLAPGPWLCASTQWCERDIPIDNTSGTNASGTLWFAGAMDVYGYAQFDWVLRLYDDLNNEVAFTEQYTDATLNRAPVMNPIGNRSGVVGQLLEFIASGSDPEGGPVSFGATNLPPGASFDAVSGRFSWTPSTVGTYGPVQVWAQDSGDGALRDAELIYISVADLPTIVSHPQNHFVMPGATTSFAVTATSSLPLNFQWRLNVTNIVGATNSSLVLSNVTLNQAGGYSVVVGNAVGGVASRDGVLTVFTNRSARLSADLSLEHLRRVMDEYHTRIPVYDDISSGGNHFHARGQIPNEFAAVGVSGSWTNNPHSGATCTRCVFTNLTGLNFGGFYFMNGILVGRAPLPYFGTTNVPGTNVAVTNFTGIDLSGAEELAFWARGEHGGEQIEFFVGGVGRDLSTGDVLPDTPFPDSMARYPARGTVTTLTTEWQRFTISLTGRNLTNIMGAFGWVANAPNNPGGAVFYLDDLEFVLSPARRAQRLNEPRFLRSFVTLPIQPLIDDGNADDDLDFVLRNTAYIYDNALAVLAFLADGSADSLRRAKLIGDAMVYAAEHDRTFTDGRLRTAYSAGSLALPPGWEPNGRKGTVTMPGYYLENPPSFFEVENRDIDTGNNAWGMIALAALYKETGQTNYLGTAKRIGDFVETFRDTNGPFQGYRGGIWFAETSNPSNRAYASTEHNLDLHAGFMQMYRLTGEAKWLSGALHARQFVESMWSEQKGGYLAGTKEEDPETPNENPDQLPLDTQSWSVAALADALTLHPNLLSCPEQNHRNTSDDLLGFDFNNDRDVVWLEGTAQMVVAYAIAGLAPEVNEFRATLHAAQQVPAPYGDGRGLVAASHDAGSTGFGFKLFRRLHVGATAWNVFAQLRYNPYYQTKSISRLVPLGFDAANRFEVRVIGEADTDYVLQRTADFLQWTSFTTNSSPTGVIDIIDSHSVSAPVSFYRALLLSLSP